MIDLVFVDQWIVGGVVNCGYFILSFVCVQNYIVQVLDYYC